MAECKRLQLEPPTPLQREKKNTELGPTYRFELTLTEPTESGCCEFSYRELVKSAEVSKPGKTSSDPLFDDDDDDEKLHDLARHFEEKYNPKPGRRKRKKTSICEDYVDRGMGYDETDPFIDNEEAYDELVPSTLTTEYGGFYVNKGSLDFRDISESNNSIDPKMRKKRRKQKDAYNNFEKDSKRRRRAGNEDDNPKRRGRKPASLPVSALPKPKKRAQPTVADMLQQHKAQLQLQQQEKLQQIQQVSIVVERNIECEVNNESPPSGVPVSGANSTISDAIESVVKAAAEDAASNGSAGLVTGSSDGEEGLAKPPIESIEAPKLPENLPPELDSLLTKLKEAAYNSEEGKCKFFSEDVNRMLLSVEVKSQELTSAQRSIIYSHLASHLPCTKETLQKRAKKLRLDQEDNKLREPMQKLKDAIQEMMPEMLEKYNLSLQSPPEVKEEKKQFMYEMPPLTDEESEEEDDTSADTPKKKFEWNDTVRKYLCDVVRIKLKCYEVSKTRIQSAKEYLKHFLDTEVKNLWPPGWMTAKILYKESTEAHSHITNRQKRQFFLPKKNALNPVTPTMFTVKPAISLLNNAVTSQESNNFEPASQTDRCVPSNVTLPLHSDLERKSDGSKLSANEELRQAEYIKLLTYPIKPSFMESHFTARTSPPAEVKKGEPVLSKSSSTLSASQRVTEPHLTATSAYGKQSGLSSGKGSELGTLAEGSVASDMLARIISASLADYPYAGSTNSDTSVQKNQSVISSSVTFAHSKDPRVLSSKLPADSFTSPKRLDEAKALCVDNRKPSQDSGSHNQFGSSNHMESLLNAQHSTKQSDATATSLVMKNKSIAPDSTKSPVNLKLKDVKVPQPRQFAEAFERSSEHILSSRKSTTTKPHSIKVSGTPMWSSSALTPSSSAGFSNASELLNAPSVSASVRTITENFERSSQESVVKSNTPSVTQGLSSAPYKKRSKYAQSSKTGEQRNHFVDTGLNVSLLEGMKGFPYPVSTLPTPPPAHCSAPLKTTTQLKDSTYGLHAPHSSFLLASSAVRSMADPRAESGSHSQQSHARLPVVEGSRRQSLIKSPWNTSPVSQPSSSLNQFLGGAQPSVTSTKSTSPNACSSAPQHSATIIYAHSHSTPPPPPPPEKSPIFSHSQSQLSSRATPSPGPVHSSRTSPSSIHMSSLFMVPQPSHSVSSRQPPVHSRSSSNAPSVHNHPSTSSNAMAGTFTFSQEQSTDPRTE